MTSRKNVQRAIRMNSWVFFVVVLMFLAACKPKIEKQEIKLYVPPTGMPKPTATQLVAVQPAAPVVHEPTATMLCSNILSFVDDVTIPDGTAVEPGGKLDKRWLLENTGTCNWHDGYSLKLIAGPDMGANPAQKLYPARSGAKFKARIVFTAPDEPGTYRSAWQAFDPDGNPFGDPFYIEIVVTSEKPDE